MENIEEKYGQNLEKGSGQNLERIGPAREIIKMIVITLNRTANPAHLHSALL